MSHDLAKIRRLGLTALAVSLMACGSVQAATPARAGGSIEAPRGDSRLTEFDTNDASTTNRDTFLQLATELDRQNELQRLAEQGATSRQAYAADEGQYCGPSMPRCDAIWTPARVP